MTGPRHIVIIGAARSGTKALRAALAAATGAGAVPHDIGYVWRHGNERSHDDALEPGQLTERQARFIRDFVDGYAAGSDPAVIEKTVGNTLRVPFVASVFPDARFIHLIRDGVDVAESSRRQWTTGSNLTYLVGKIRHVPLRLMPRQGVRYVGSRMSRVFRADRRLATWGPRYPGIDDDLATTDMLLVCARQWRESVRFASGAFKELDIPVLEIRYEGLVDDATGTLRSLVEFLELPDPPADKVRAAAAMISGRTGVGRGALTDAELRCLDAEIGLTLQGLGYQRSRVGEVADG